MKNKEGFIHSDTSKAEILNEQFQSVYTKENTSTMPDKGQSKYPSMKDIVINTKGVFKLLKDLNPHKATGPELYTVIYTKECCRRTGTNFNATIPVLTSRRGNTI